MNRYQPIRFYNRSSYTLIHKFLVVKWVSQLSERKTVAIKSGVLLNTFKLEVNLKEAFKHSEKPDQKAHNAPSDSDQPWNI